MAKRGGTGNKNGKFSHSGRVSLDFYGFSELLQKIDDAGGNVTDALSKSLVASSKPIERDLGEFMVKHHRTGRTISSFENLLNVDRMGLFIDYKLGFNKDKHGLPALFLDIGTPTQNPHYFIYYAFNNNVDRVKAEQEKALREILEELM